jgi:GT2 family glycosyltransferase/glycosyltransferase involved in cell wall biosynthesis
VRPTAEPVTVVVPVYDGLDETVGCIESVLRHGASVPMDVLVIDDLSPNAALRDYLDELAARDHTVPVQVVHHPTNLGFVRTCNEGFRSCRGDVVLLNSDTVVTAGWLDRLADAAGEPDVATVTPLTSSGSICTLPRSVIDAFDLFGAEPRIDECADFVAAHSVRLRPEVITGVGFCMYVTRHALDQCGIFDEEAFGRGYGEEVDFCLRATRHGYRHLVEDATYVHHHGGASFAEERDERKEASSRVLHERHRFFRTSLADERAHNPLAVSLASLELGLSARDPRRPHVLQLLHSPPGALGGTEKHVAALLGALADEFDFSVLHPVESGFVLRTLWRRPDGTTAELEFFLPGGARRVEKNYDAEAAAALEMALDWFRFDAVHIQNLIGYSLAPLDVLAHFDGPVVCSVRDLFLACPNHSLLYLNRQACGIPEDLSYCAECLPESRELQLEDLVEFRGGVRAGLDTVDTWVFATQSAADYLLRAYDIDPDRIQIITHGAVIPTARHQPVDEDLVLHEPLRIAFVGRGWSKKGLDTVNHLADQLTDTPIEIHHFGEPVEPASVEVHVHGTYNNRFLPNLLRLAGIHIVLLPGHYAETFGHVMTESLIAGIPIIGATYGALGERIRTHGVGWTIDPDDPDELLALIRRLDAARFEILRATRRAHRVPLQTMSVSAVAYAAIYRGDEPAGISTDEPIEEPTTTRRAGSLK